MEAKNALKQFEGIGGPPIVEPCSTFDLLQGDVYSEIPFCYIDEDGDISTIMQKAQLLSNTCDASREDGRLIFAAVRPLKDLEENPTMVESIVSNKKFGALYLPGNPLRSEYVDLQLLNSMSHSTFCGLQSAQKVNRIATLSNVGYYLFICKMTIFFLRPEDVDVNSQRS